jgi:hypothetical protein
MTLRCQINNNIITIYYLSGNPKSLQGVGISLILAVKNPFSTEPLKYTVTSYFNSAPSQIFSSEYSLTFLATGTIAPVKSNNTFGLPSTLSLIVYLPFSLIESDVMEITNPLGMFIFTEK